MGYNVNDIIGEEKIELELDKKFVIEEAFEYDKIFEFKKTINNNILLEVL